MGENKVFEIEENTLMASEKHYGLNEVSKFFQHLVLVCSTATAVTILQMQEAMPEELKHRNCCVGRERTHWFTAVPAAAGGDGACLRP